MATWWQHVREAQIVLHSPCTVHCLDVYAIATSILLATLDGVVLTIPYHTSFHITPGAAVSRQPYSIFYVRLGPRPLSLLRSFDRMYPLARYSSVHNLHGPEIQSECT